MTPLAAAILILRIVDRALEMRLRQYDANADLIKIDADAAAELSGAVLAVVASAAKVGDAIGAGLVDLLDG
ncbi:hypothetical protein LCGC14_3129300 [marine sediment metagenome]|uniref:Uncharacterized protein n=1 Tax=marine sediment metagenome TaxID=412755 RepID=A0A0F8YPM0_9ZZZZ